MSLRLVSASSCCVSDEQWPCHQKKPGPQHAAIAKAVSPRLEPHSAGISRHPPGHHGLTSRRRSGFKVTTCKNASSPPRQPRLVERDRRRSDPWSYAAARISCSSGVVGLSFTGGSAEGFPKKLQEWLQKSPRFYKEYMLTRSVSVSLSFSQKPNINPKECD